MEKKKKVWLHEVGPEQVKAGGYIGAVRVTLHHGIISLILAPGLAFSFGSMEWWMSYRYMQSEVELATIKWSVTYARHSQQLLGGSLTSYLARFSCPCILEGKSIGTPCGQYSARIGFADRSINQGLFFFSLPEIKLLEILRLIVFL